MRTFTTRLISAALAAGMMLSILPASAFAAGVDTGGGSNSSPDTVSAQTLDMQNDASTAELKIDASGYPEGTNGGKDAVEHANWTYSEADGLTIISGTYNLNDQPAVQCKTTFSGSTDTADEVKFLGGTFANDVVINHWSSSNSAVFLKKPVQGQDFHDEDMAGQIRNNRLTSVKLDNADDYTVNDVPASQLVDNIFYVSSDLNAGLKVEVKYTGTKPVYRWKADTVKVENGEATLVPTWARTLTPSADGRTLTISFGNTYNVPDSINLLRAMHTQPRTAKFYLKDNATGVMQELKPDANQTPTFHWTETGYSLIADEGYSSLVAKHRWSGQNYDINNITEADSWYQAVVEYPETDEYDSSIMEAYFAITKDPFYTVKVNNGKAIANASEIDETTALNADDVIQLKLADDADASAFLGWSFEKTDGIQFKMEDDSYTDDLTKVDLTSPELSFKMPAYDVVVTAVFDVPEPVPGGDDSTVASSDGGAGAIVAGTLLGGTAYLVGTHVWLNSLYGTVPTNRQQLALALWEKAGKPAPASTALFEDISADDADAQAAARWCTEQGLVKDYGGTTFKPGRYVFRVQALKAWYDLQKLNG